jgi:hypothetical protein
MKTLLALTAVTAALIFAGPAGAMPIYDAYPPPTAAPAAPPPSDHTALWAALAGGVAFVLGAGSARLAGPVRRRARAVT